MIDKNKLFATTINEIYLPDQWQQILHIHQQNFADNAPDNSIDRH